MIEWRPYKPQDQDDCLAVFNSNSPAHFLPEERGAYFSFLESPPGPYGVLVEDGKISACGGYAISAPHAAATLCWGMVERSAQGRGLGQLLLALRVMEVAAHNEMERIVLSADLSARGFFLKHGFGVCEVVMGGYGPDKDMFLMDASISSTLVRAMRDIIVHRENEGGFRCPLSS